MARGSAVARLGGVLLLVGVLVGVAAIPAGAVLLAGARWAGRQRADLPTQLLEPPAAQLTRVYASDAKTLITTFYDEDRHDVGLGQIATVMQQAVVAAEDTRFYEHGGVDLLGAARALVTDTADGRASQGASTLTMQLVRNVLKEDPDLGAGERAAATADTASRKLREMAYAIELEHRLSKPQILQNYLNIVYFGDGAYGIEAASRRVFGVTPARLDLAQAALIAGIVQSPDADNPIGGDRTRARERQLYVLGAMARAGLITPAQQRSAAAEKLTFAGRAEPNGCVEAGGWGFFCDYVRRWWDSQQQFGSTGQERDLALRRGGYTVVTTLDPAVQRAAAAVAEARKLGIGLSAPNDAEMARTSAATWGSFTLGVADTTPLELASAYATVAAGGRYCAPVPVASITDARQARVPVASGCRQVLPVEVARAAADAARCPVGQQSAFGKCDGGTAAQVTSIMGGRPVAGKTGSTEDNTTETFVGFTPSLAAAGIAADPADPSDKVGSAVEARVVTAVARTLRAAAGAAGYPGFVPPGAAIAFGR